MRVIAFLLSLLAVGAQANDNWPQFRGPAGDGHADSSNLPVTWSETENVRWKTAIHGRAWSSPVIWGKQVWVTTASEDGKELFAVCLDRDSGKITQNIKLFDVENPQFAHKFNTYASPTPVIEEGRVYVTFGSPGTACLDTATGKVLWTRRDFECNHYRGAGSSPILVGNLLVMHFDGSDHQYVAAVDKNTGKTVWQTKRSIDFKDLKPDGQPEAEGDFRKAFATPHFVELGGQPMIISQGAKAAYAYEPKTGRELWRVEERSAHSASTRPVVGNGLIYFPTGFSRGQLLAVRPNGQGDVTESHVAWVVKRNVPNKPSLVFLNDLLFMVDDGGIASCLSARDGGDIWRERVGGNFSASPLCAGGRIYFFNEEGKATVIEASRTFKVLAENKLEEGFMASPAAAGDALYLRTKTHLYRIEK